FRGRRVCVDADDGLLAARSVLLRWPQRVYGRSRLRVADHVRPDRQGREEWKELGQDAGEEGCQEAGAEAPQAQEDIALAPILRGRGGRRGDLGHTPSSGSQTAPRGVSG